jgi:hypothetical protein
MFIFKVTEPSPLQDSSCHGLDGGALASPQWGSGRDNKMEYANSAQIVLGGVRSSDAMSLMKTRKLTEKKPRKIRIFSYEHVHFPWGDSPGAARGTGCTYLMTSVHSPEDFWDLPAQSLCFTVT